MAKLFDIATLDDIPAILALSADAAKRYDKLMQFEYSDVVFSNTLKFMVTQPTSVVIIEKSEDQVTGVIGLIASQHYYSTSIMVTKLFWFANSKKSAVKLLDLARKWAKLKGAEKLVVSQPTPGHTLGPMQSVELSFIEDL